MKLRRLEEQPKIRIYVLFSTKPLPRSSSSKSSSNVKVVVKISKETRVKICTKISTKMNYAFTIFPYSTSLRNVENDNVSLHSPSISDALVTINSN